MNNRTRSLIATFIVILLWSPISSFGQDAEFRDRLSRVRDLVGNSEVVLMWSEDDGTDQVVKQQIYDVNLVDFQLEGKGVQSDSEISGNRKLAVATGNFLGSDTKHFVGAWTGPNGSVTIAVPEIDKGTLSWTSTSSLIIPGPVSTAKGARLNLETGDFLGDSFHDEFVLGYQDENDMIRLQVFDFEDGDLTPRPLGSINDEMVGPGLESWDIATGDFDGDSDDEIALFFIKRDGGINLSLHVKIYSVEDNGGLTARASKEIFVHPNPNDVKIDDITGIGVHVAGATGDFDDDPQLEVAFAFSFLQDNMDNDTFLYLLNVSENLDEFDKVREIGLSKQNESSITPINLATGDLNGNFRDEVVLSAAGGWQVFTIDDDLNPQKGLNGGSGGPHLPPGDNEGYHDSDAFLAVADVDNAPPGQSEIIFAGSRIQDDPGTQYLTLQVTAFDTTAVIRRKPGVGSNLDSEIPIPSNLARRSFAIALGDFDADRVRLGRPQKFTRKAVMQPSVVLYTPPIHYDILGSVPYDLSGCYPDQSCGFSSEYTQTSTTDVTLTVEVHEDWGVSASEEAIWADQKVKLTATYGEKFSLTSTSKQSTTISTGRVAAGDDWIYANIFDIDYYEYPVYDGQNPTPIGYFLVSIPGEARPLWIEGKDDLLLGNQFRPDHEVGNILSYRSVNTPDASNVIVEFPEQTIGSTGSSSTSLLLSTFTENIVQESWDATFEIDTSVGLDGDIKGIEFGGRIDASGKYGVGEITTQTVSVGESLEMKAILGRVVTGTEATYQIQPYAYWTRFGALAIDYKVAIPTQDGTFWKEWYGDKTDLGFSLPWRYDIEKGNTLPLGDASYKMRTRDIVLSKPVPVGGDIVQIGARVRNMGLDNVTVPVSVDFYLGDPAGGGTLIASAETGPDIESRSSQTVIVEWPIPVAENLNNKRIYVVIDADDHVTNEVHENNNTGWAPVISFSIATAAENSTDLPTGMVLEQNYPNPFNPKTTIRFDIPRLGHVRLTVYNVIGQEVERLIDRQLGAASHEFSWDASGLPTGLYFYRLTAGSFSETKTMILMK